MTTSTWIALLLLSVQHFAVFFHGARQHHPLILDAGTVTGVERGSSVDHATASGSNRRRLLSLPVVSITATTTTTSADSRARAARKESLSFHPSTAPVNAITSVPPTSANTSTTAVVPWLLQPSHANSSYQATDGLFSHSSRKSNSPRVSGRGVRLLPVDNVTNNNAFHQNTHGNGNGTDPQRDALGTNYDYHNNAPNKHDPPKFDCGDDDDDFFQGNGGGGCNFTATAGNPHELFGTHPPGRRPTSADPKPHHPTSQPPSTAPTPKQQQPDNNLIELGVSVLFVSVVASSAADGSFTNVDNEMYVMNQVSQVVYDLLNTETSFHVVDVEDDDSMSLNNGTNLGGNSRIPRNQTKNNVWLVSDPTHTTNVTLLSDHFQRIWRRYQFRYQTFRGDDRRDPIQDEKTLERIAMICRNVIDSAIASDRFLHELQQHNVGIFVGVAKIGDEDGYSPNHNIASTFPDQLSMTTWDVRRWMGVGLFCSTIAWTIVLLHLGARRQVQLKNEAVWGNIAIGTEEDVGNLLNLGFVWQQQRHHGQDGPPAGVVVFNKQSIGYSDNDSMLRGGFQNFLHEIIDTTLPSSATTSWEARCS